MPEGWLIPLLRQSASQEDEGKIWPEDVIKIVGWANSCAILLRQYKQGLRPTDPNMLNDVLDTGERIGLLPTSPVKETP